MKVGVEGGEGGILQKETIDLVDISGKLHADY